MNLVKLTDVCDFQGGSQPPKSEWIDSPQDGYIRMLQIRDFTQDGSKVEYVKKTNSLKTCIEDDILLARYGASVGKILTGLSGAYNVAIMKTIPSDSLERDYLYYYLHSPYFQSRIINVGSRAAQAGFNKDELSKLSIPLRSRDEQKIISNKIRRVDDLIEKRQAQLDELNNLVKSRYCEELEVVA